MSDKQSVADTVVAQLSAAGVGDVTTKAMFGGFSVRVDDAEVAKVTKDAELQMRSDAEVASVFEGLGDKQLTNSFGGDTPRLMPYFVIEPANQGSLGRPHGCKCCRRQARCSSESGKEKEVINLGSYQLG